MDAKAAPEPENYPIGLDRPCLLGEDRELYHTRLLEDSPRLFKSDEIDVGILAFSRDRRGGHSNRSEVP